MKRFIIIFLSLMWAVTSMAQMPGGKAVEVSHKTQMVRGKCYFVHIVDQGQTVYAIARAYGLKEVEAVTRKDIHFLQVGDTVWLPCKGQQLSDGTTAPDINGTISGSGKNTSTPSVTPKGTPNAATKGNVNTSDGESQGASATIRPRVNPQSIVVSLMMPLHLSQIDKVSTSKFDVDQRGKTSYKVLEFIQFYEGLLLGLEQLEKKGYNVTLNVVDVEGDSDEAVETAFRSHNVAKSDLLIAMLTRQPFRKVAALAREAQLFVVNPVADRADIVKDNPYVFKCMPSVEARARAIVHAIEADMPGAPIYIVHSKSANERPMLQALQQVMDVNPKMQYTLVDWNGQTKLYNQLRNQPLSVVVSLYDQDKSKNRIYVQQLLNKLSGLKSNPPCLFTVDDWTTEYSDVDFGQLQGLSYHTFYEDWNLTDQRQKDFIETFRDRYKTEPITGYAGMANDIIIYFVTGLQQRGTDFYKSPAMARPEGMLYPLSFSHTRNDYGFENQSAVMYRMADYHFYPIR